MKRLFLSSLVAIAVLSSCEDDDDSTTANTGNNGNNGATTEFLVTIENVFEPKDYSMSGVFNTPVGSTSPGPAMPGSAYEFSFYAAPGARLSFATMYVQSNDLFYAPADDGIALYDGSGNALSGDITSQIELWDGGTEVNQMPGTGADQAPRQSGPNTGADENGVVQLVNDGFTYPTNNTVIQVMVANTGNMFTVTINNISGSATIPSPLAPGVWVVHNSGNPLFIDGQADFGDGLEGVAEDGNAGPLGMALEARSGYVSPFAPGVYAIHEHDVQPLFMNGQADYGDGLEGLAEDGSVATLGAALAANPMVSAYGIFNTPDGGASPGPIGPGASYSFTVTATDGDHLSLATMLIQTNDLFYAFGQDGLDLFTTGGAPRSGDVTPSLQLWDAGTEVNEFPGVGMYQAPRQSGPDSGPDENGTVRIVNDGFTYPAVSDAIRITLTPQ